MSIAGDSGYFFLSDVSIQSGVQHDLVDMLKYGAQDMPYPRSGGMNKERAELRMLLNQRVENYSTSIGSDECTIYPSRAMWGRFSGVANARKTRIRILVRDMISLVLKMHSS